MRFTLEIELGNDAMQTYAAIDRAIHQAVYLPGKGQVVVGDHSIVRDINGNTVGKWEVTETPAEQAAALTDEDDDGNARLEEVL